MGYDIRDRDNIGEISVNHPNHIVVTADMSSSTWNTVASHEVFNVTGLASVRLWIVCTSDLTSGGSATLDFGYEGSMGTWAADVSYAGIDANEMLSGAMTSFEPTDNNKLDFNNWGWDIMLWDRDIGYEIKVAALTGGTLEFHCIWSPLTAGATVTAGSGGSL